MYKCLAAFALFVLLFGVSANAVAVNAPATIVVQQQQKLVLVTIENDLETEQDYSIRLSGPFNAVLSPSAGKIGAGKTTIASLSIMPAKKLEGSTYEGILEVQLGEEKAFSEITVLFKGEERETNEAETVQAGLFSLADFSGIVSGLFTPENVLNTGLGLVAAVLLIAFIARFVKRLEASK